jgi:hypothetical protein
MQSLTDHDIGAGVVRTAWPSQGFALSSPRMQLP